MRIRRLLCWVVLVCVATPALAEGKFAFVVGINSYPQLGPDAQLERAVADANAIGEALHSLGFEVTLVTQEPKLATILNQFEKFTSRIQAGDTVVFYYAGHGISLDDGNYLVPADVPLLGPSDERIAKRLTIPARDFSQDIAKAGARVAVMVIDACRNNPFPSKGTRALGVSTRGLARMAQLDGIFTLYSAREGQAAIDRLSGADNDANSVFTRVFLKELKSPGVNLSELGDRVRDEVAALARADGQDQVPAVYNDLLGSRTVFLAGPPPAAPTGAPFSPAAAPPIVVAALPPSSQARVPISGAPEPKPVNAPVTAFTITVRLAGGAEPLRRNWKLVAPNRWAEIYPEGTTNYFVVVGRKTLNSCLGTVVKSRDAPSHQAFIPDKGCAGMPFYVNDDNKGWGVASAMTKVQ